jgi:hypothetical protein
MDGRVLSGQSQFKCCRRSTDKTKYVSTVSRFPMKCPVCDARSFASDSRPVKRPLGNELDENSSTALGPGRRRSYCCDNDHRFTTYEVLGEKLPDTVLDARDMRNLRHMLAREQRAKM